MKYRLLVLDLDGTLTNSKKEISEHTRKTLMKFQKAGGRIVLASGRPTYGIVPLMEELKLKEYGGFMLSFNGGMIIECATGKTIYQDQLPQEMPALLSRLAKENDADILTYQNEFIITENGGDVYIQKEVAINKMQVREVEAFGEYVVFPVTKCLMVGEGNHMAEVEEIMKAQVGDRINVFRSEPYFLELMPQNVDKAASLEKLIKHLDMRREEVMACGDGFNDKTMIAFAGLGVAMENAQKSVKKIADFVAPSNDDDGVAYAVNKFCME